MSLQHSPSIVTSGMVLCLDAANPRSYPGTGAIWNDLSADGNTGTLINGPTYNSANLGTPTFNGTSQYVDLGVNKFNYATSTVIFQLGGYKGTGQTCYWWARSSSFDQWADFGFAMVGGYFKMSPNVTVCTYASIGNYDNFAFVTTGTTSVVYQNGGYLTTITGVNPMNNGTMGFNTSIGRAGSYNNYYFDGKFAFVQAYNRALSAAEISQNFTATRGRYGI